MGCNCGKNVRRQPLRPTTDRAAPTPPSTSWAWRVLLPDGTTEDGYDEAGAVRRARDAGGTYEAVLPSDGVAII